ncbi:MAG TPA: alpha-ketoacid dehydrogenase subunit beta [Planctomycetota bacterium]|nr:alpha-ketoacid dehydrogenase subunit beta [Planctomycetota bacterium]
MAETTYLEAIRRGLFEEMNLDPKVVVLGEDVGLFGGAFKVTKGLLEKFGSHRVIDTPISEAAMAGFALGAASVGMRPIVEFQFLDFMAPAFNQIVNMAAKWRWRWGVGASMVLRGPVGAGNRAGPFHSVSPEMWYAHSPGIKVVAPGTPRDALGLIKSAIRDPDPVLFLEHKKLYRSLKEDLPDGEQFLVPLGSARVARPGDTITLVTYGAMLQLALQAAGKLAEEGISLEVIDLRTILPLDMPTILESVKKTSKLIILHEDVRTGGVAGEIAMRVVEEAFDDLDGPIVRVTSQDCPVPQAPTLEDFFLPSLQDVLEAARKLAAY